MCRQGSVLGVLGVVGVWSLANGRLECPNKRGLCAGKGQAAMLERWRPGAWWKLPRGMCRQRAGCNPGAAKADGQAWWKLPRTFKARAEKFHTCGGPRRRPGLGEGRGRRIQALSLARIGHAWRSMKLPWENRKIPNAQMIPNDSKWAYNYQLFVKCWWCDGPREIEQATEACIMNHLDLPPSRSCTVVVRLLKYIVHHRIVHLVHSNSKLLNPLPPAILKVCLWKALPWAGKLN